MHILSVVAHQLADAWCVIRIRNDFQQIIRRGHHFLGFGLRIQRRVLVTHRTVGNAYRTVIQGAHQRITFNRQLGVRNFLREAPEFTTAQRRGRIIQIQIVAVSTCLAILIHN